MNKAILFGNVGQDPAIRTIESGKKVGTFSLATTERKGKGDERTSETTWHNIVVWEKLAELCEKYVKKGNPLIIEGKINYRTYQDKDGNTKYITEIIAKELHFAGGKRDDTKTQLDLAKETIEFKDDLSDIPF